MKILNISMVTGLFISLCSCTASNTCEWEQDLEKVSVYPASIELTGVYKPDDHTRKSIAGYDQSPNAEIILEKDDKIKVNNVPASTFNFVYYAEGNHQAVNGKGRWLESFYTPDKQLRISTGIHFDSDLLNNTTSFYRLYRQGKKYVILLNIGHPDDCLAARFIQQ